MKIVIELSAILEVASLTTGEYSRIIPAAQTQSDI